MMNMFDFSTAEFSTRICLTLMHSLWQVALLALVAWMIERLVSRRFPEVGYITSSLMLLAALISLPITFHALADAKSVASQTSPVEVSLLTISEHDATVHDGDVITVPGDAHSQDHSEAVVVQVEVQSQSARKAKPQAVVFELSRVTPWVVVVYLLGVLWMIMRLVNSIRHACRLSKSGSPVTSGPVFEALQKLGEHWSMKVLPTLSVAKECLMPKVIGVLKPTILLPASALGGLSEAELEIVLLHELAHVRRHDLWMNLMQRLAEVVLFFNPALWWLSYRISTQREYCCDEMACRAMATMKQDHSHIPRTKYAFTLLRIVEMMQGQPPSESLTTLAMSDRSPSELRRRVGRLFGESVEQPVSPSRGGILFVVAGVFIMMCTALWSSPQEVSILEDKKPENNNAALVEQLKQECRQVTDGYHRSNQKELVSLDLFDASKEAIETVSKVEGLKDLEFIATDLRETNFDAIQKLTSLKRLTLINCQFHPQQMLAFHTLTELEELFVTFTVFQELESWRLEQIGKLSETEQQLSSRLKNDFEVGDHVIQATLLTDRAMPALENLTQLKSLKLINTFVSPVGLQSLSNLKNLETLSIGLIGQTAEDLKPLLGMKQLKSLRRFNANDAIVEQLSQIKSLEELDIWASGVTDVGATHLAKLTNMRELSINGNQMTAVGLNQLTKLPVLEKLEVKGATMSPKEYEQLQIPKRLMLWGPYSINYSGMRSTKNSSNKTRYTGIIIDEEGKPLTEKGMLTYDTRIDRSRGASGNAGEFTDQFSIQLPSGKTYLTYHLKGYAPTDVGPFSGDKYEEVRNIIIVMKRGVEQRIRVVNEAGKPIPKATVISHPEFHGKADGFIYPKTTDQNGEYLYEHLAETRYEFKVEAVGFETLRTKPLDLKPGEVLTLTMTRAQPTTGVVLNPDGTPAANALLRAQWVDTAKGTSGFSDGKSGSWWGEVFAKTNGKGEFTLNQLTRDAQYLFIVQAEDGNRLIYRKLKAGQKDVTIELLPRRDLVVFIHGDLSQLPQRGGKPYVNMRQRCKTQTSDGGTHGDLFGQAVLIQPNKTGGSVRFPGLAIDPEAEQQVIEVYFNDSRQILPINDWGETVVEFDLTLAKPPAEWAEKLNLLSTCSI